MLEISDFQNINPRFLLPLREIDIRFSFNELYLQPAGQVFVRSALSNALRDATASYEQIGRAELNTRMFAAAEDDSGSNASTQVYAYGEVLTPGYAFAIQIGRRAIRFYKRNTSLNDALRAFNVMQDVMERLAPPLPTENSFADELDLRGEGFYGSSFEFSLELSLGEDLNNRTKQVLNTDLIARLIKKDLAVGQATSSAPVSGLQLESIIRGDLSVIGFRTLGESRREVVVAVACPFNTSQKNVDLTFGCRSGNQGNPFLDSHLHDFQTPIIHFYRDLILRQFMEDAFGSAAVEARL